MTCKEALNALCRPYFAQDDTLTFNMIEAGVDGAAEYDGTQREGLYTAAFYVLKALKSITGITEGGFSIQYSPAELNNKLVTIAHQSGNKSLQDEAAGMQQKPTITGKSPW